MKRQHLLALCDLRGDAVPQRVVGGEVAHGRVALHLDESARDRPLRGVQVEEPEVRTLEADLVAQLVGDLLQHAVQLEVRVERNDDLVLEDALVLQVEARERESEGFRALRRRRDELQREPPRQRAELVEQQPRRGASRRRARTARAPVRSSASSSATERDVMASRWPRVLAMSGEWSMR